MLGLQWCWQSWQNTQESKHLESPVPPRRRFLRAGKPRPRARDHVGHPIHQSEDCEGRELGESGLRHCRRKLNFVCVCVWVGPVGWKLFLWGESPKKFKVTFWSLPQFYPDQEPYRPQLEGGYWPQTSLPERKPRGQAVSGGLPETVALLRPAPHTATSYRSCRAGSLMVRVVGLVLRRVGALG